MFFVFTYLIIKFTHIHYFTEVKILIFRKKVSEMIFIFVKLNNEIIDKGERNV
jgi:hypothetical protein